MIRVGTTKKACWVIMAIAILLFAPASGAAQNSGPVHPADSQSGGPMITVLCYHHVGLSVKTEYSVTSEQLSAQLTALRSAGFSFIDSAALEAFYATGAPIPQKSALVTFDDGDYDVYTRAYPLLRKLGIPFTFFVYPNAVNEGHAKHCVEWADLNEMAANGVTIGCHTMSHPFLTKPPAAVTDKAAYDAWLDTELVKSKAEIEARIGKPVTEFAVPFGAYDSYVRDKIEAAGYTLAFNVHGANADIRSDRMSVNRIIVKASMSLDYFLELATAPPIYFDETFPSDLSRVETENTKISFKINGAGAFDENTVQSKVTSFSGLELKHVREGDFFVESVDLRRPTYYAVFVWAKDKKGRLCRGAWLFLFEKALPDYLRP